MLHGVRPSITVGGMSAPQRITAIYRIETPLEVAQAAGILAGEQSSGTFVAVPGETDELREKHAARVEKITELETVGSPSLGSNRKSPGPYRRAEIVVSWPIENVGYNLPTLVSTLQGNLYELSQFSGLKLMDHLLNRMSVYVVDRLAPAAAVLIPRLIAMSRAAIPIC